MFDLELVKKNEDLNDGYYHILNDLIKYPDAVIYVVWSKRGPGKTYSTLWTSWYYPVPMMYMKRTNEDVEFICNEKYDLSPYKDVNRDKGILVKPRLIDKGLGAFYNITYDDKGNEVPEGAPVSLLVSLNKIKSIKGIGASEYDWMVFDEFIEARKTRSYLKGEVEIAAALGVNVLKYKLIAISSSAFFAALAGTFYAQYYGLIDPSIVFASSISVEAIVPCINRH